MRMFITISKETKEKIYNLVITDYEKQFEELKANKPKLSKPKYRTDIEKQQAKEYRHHYQRLSNNINALKKVKMKLDLKGE